jgi:DNA-binding transcriptional ArsR family regulator
MSDAKVTGTAEAGGPRFDENDQLVLETLDAVRAVADSLRLRILFETTYTPRTVKEIAARLDVPQTRLYYHVKLLEKHGLLWVVERRMVSGIEERRYRSPTGGFTISPGLLSEAVDAGLLDAAFDLTAAELSVALAHEKSEPGRADSTVPLLTFNRMWLRPDDIGDMIREIGELIERYDARSPVPGTREYSGVFAMYVNFQAERASDAP